MDVRVRTKLRYPCDARTLFELIASDDGILSFVGFGPIPGTRETRRETGDHHEVGAIGRTTNADGTTHRETVLEVEPPRRYRLRIDEFSSVFRFIVRYAEETYAIEGVEAPVELHRTFVFHPTTPLVLPLTIPLAYGAFRVALHRSNLRMRALIAERAGW
ncbi:MAG TPA: hypothetical protein DEF51_21505 [Myxococcales bacterium]|nr:hypothetical protein [Myxococcales bacterium]